MYHCVYRNNPTESGFQNVSAFQYKISAKTFEEQVVMVRKYCDTNEISNDCIEFTFDDGGVSFYEVIAPILEKYNFNGIFFISTKYVGTESFLTKAQIYDLYKRGHIIGSHSHSHPQSLSALNNDEIKYEWKHSSEILSKIIDAPIFKASIPNGYESTVVNKFALESGYKELYTSKPSDKITQFKEMNIIGRYVVHDTTSNKELLAILSSKIRRNKMYYRWLLLSMIKKVLGNKYNNLKSIIINKK